MPHLYRGSYSDVRPIFPLVAALLMAWVLRMPAWADESSDWPGFRGTQADGVSSASDIFGSGGERLEVAWKCPLGGGYSGVSIADGRAVTIFTDRQSDVVISLDAENGRELWRYVLDETYKGHDGSQDGPISTPFLADGRVFVLSPRGKLVALDASSGQEIWKTDLVRDHGAAKPHWGFGTSPLIVSGVLVVELGAKDAMVCGFDPQTGKRLWSCGDDQVYYQSPVPFSAARESHRSRVLVAGNSKLLCIDPQSGAVTWEYRHDGSGEYGAICLVPVPLDERHILLDHKDDRSMLLGITSNAEPTAFERLWEEQSFGKSYSVAVHHNGYLYGYNGRIFSCVDAKTGNSMWRSRQPGDGFPIVVDDHLIILTKDGRVHVARASCDDYQEVAELKVFADLAWAPPSFARGSIYARSFGEIARIDIRAGSAPALARPDAEPDIAGTRLGELLKQLSDADDKSMAIDRFISAIGQFPMVEPDGRVVFVYRGPGDDLAIGGDLTGFGNKLPMKRVPGTDLFYSVARLEPDAHICYAFVRDFKALPDPLNPRKTVVSGFDDEMELSFGTAEIQVSWIAMPEWKPPTHLDEPDESRRGRIESHTFHSAALNADVSCDVYTPVGYAPGTGRLPVAYIHSGRLARDSLRVPTVLDNLVGRRIAPLIAVFINQDPPFFGDPKEYATMCAQELPRFIDERYPTIQSPDARAHIACGPAGYAVLYTVLTHPNMVSKLGMQSPWLIQVEVIEPVMKNASDAPLTVYLDWGKYDLRSKLEFWSVAEMGRKLDQYFRDHGYEPIGGEAHDGSGEPSWQNRLDDLFQALFPLHPATPSPG